MKGERGERGGERELHDGNTELHNGNTELHNGNTELHDGNTELHVYVDCGICVSHLGLFQIRECVLHQL